jgi:HTH-type transcriptional regulator / antitoxin MqsA
MSNQNNICPLCEEGHLQSRTDQEELEYKGHKGMTPLYYSECDACGSEQADAVQTRNNKRAMLAFKKTVDGLLTGVEIKVLRSRLGINQVQAAAIFGGGPVAFSKYENDDVMQSEAMDKLLRLAEEMPAAFNNLAKKAGVVLNDSRTAQYVLNEEVLKAEIEKPGTTRPHLRLVHSSPELEPEPSVRYGYR